MIKGFSIIIDGKEAKVSAEKANDIIDVLRNVNNCYVDDYDGYIVHPFEEYDNDIIRELATLLGADINETDDDGEKMWREEDR